MRRLVSALLLAAVALCAASGRAVLAQEGPGADEVQRRIQWLRDLPQDERVKLKAALERFRSLPAAQREKLRRRAAKLGPERLDGLAGRDIKSLQTRRVKLDAEIDQLMTLLAPEMLAKLSADERAYMRAEALRGFQRHFHRRLLALQTYDEWDKLSPEVRRARVQAALKRVVADRMTRLPEEERARILALPPKGQAAERARLLSEYRLDQTLEFSRIFENFRLQKFVKATQDERDTIIRKWREKSRWHELAAVLREDVGVAVDVRRDLAALGPAEWAKVMYEFQQTDALPLAERKLRLEQMIHRMAGERALDTSPREPRVAPFLRALRERRLVNGAFPAGPRPPARNPEELR